MSLIIVKSNPEIKFPRNIALFIYIWLFRWWLQPEIIYQGLLVTVDNNPLKMCFNFHIWYCIVYLPLIFRRRLTVVDGSYLAMQSARFASCQYLVFINTCLAPRLLVLKRNRTRQEKKLIDLAEKIKSENWTVKCEQGMWTRKMCCFKGSGHYW